MWNQVYKGWSCDVLKLRWNDSVMEVCRIGVWVFSGGNVLNLGEINLNSINYFLNWLYIFKLRGSFLVCYQNTWNLRFKLQTSVNGGCRGYCGFSRSLEGWIRLPEHVREVVGSQIWLQKLRVAQESLGGFYKENEQKGWKWASFSF